MKYFLGIDCGGTVTKAALYSQYGHEIAVVAVETEMLIPQPGFVERDMDRLRDSVYTTIHNLLAKVSIDVKSIACVACCGHGKGLYLWGNDQRPVRNAILSTDNRAVQYQIKWQRDGTEKKAFQKSLQHVMACQPVALLAWLKDNESAALKRTQWIFACKDYVRFCLTGIATAELTDYSGCNLINLHTKSYDPELLELFGLREIYDKLPPLCKSTDICGSITREASQATGLLEGTPVAGGMFDIDACAVAVNAAKEDRLCVIAGTWSINEYIRNSPVADGNVAMNSIFCDPNYYLTEESSATSAVNNEWFIQTMLPELRKESAEQDNSIYEICNKLVESISVKEPIPIFLPFLYASNVHPNAKGAFIGIMGYHTRAHMIRSVYEGILFCHKYHIDKLLKSRDLPVKAIQLAGGMARSNVWVQMLADITQLPIETIDVNETGTLGCAIAAAVSTGLYSTFSEAAENMVSVKDHYIPNQAYYSDYMLRYGLYCKVIDALDSTWDDFRLWEGIPGKEL